MNRASPVELRQSLEMANLLVKSGIPFVCVPYTSNAERDELVKRANDTLESASKDEP